MRTFIFITLFIITCSATYAQTPKGSVVVDLNEFAFRWGHSPAEWVNFNKDPDTEGSQFLEEFWSNGTMFLKNDTTIQGLEFRYNIFARQMQLRTNTDTLVLIHPEKVKRLNFNNRNFTYEPYVNVDRTNRDYFEILVDGKCRLLLRREVSFVPKSPPVTPLSPGQLNNRFVLHEDLFLQHKGATAILLKPTKKNVLAFLEDHKNELNVYIKNEKIRFNDRNSLAKLIRYYNSLKENK